MNMQDDEKRATTGN